jgi:hypothetical protein
MKCSHASIEGNEKKAENAFATQPSSIVNVTHIFTNASLKEKKFIRV